MRIYRIAKSEYADDLSGVGAQLYGGRWNPKGFPMVYTACSISLAILEYMAHNFHLMPSLELALVTIEIDKKALIEEIGTETLPKRWSHPSQDQKFTQGLGAEFIKSKRAYALKVPSAIVPQEYNLLLNPHSDIHIKTKIIETISPFQVDQRLFT